jgi:hypothetical protein
LLSTTPVTPRPAIELARALDRVLPRHRIGDVQQIGSACRIPNRLQLGHQVIVNVQAPCRVHDDVVVPEIGGFRDRAFRARHGIHLAHRVMDAHAGPRLLPDDGQLLNGRRPLDVSGHEQGVLPLLREPLRQFSRGGRLAGALQAQQEDDPRPLVRRLQPALGIAEQGHHFVADDLHDLLRRRQALQHILSHRAVADTIHERLDDLEVDVGFEQRQPDLAERRLDVLGGQPRFAPEALENVLKTVTKRIKHE